MSLQLQLHEDRKQYLPLVPPFKLAYPLATSVRVARFASSAGAATSSLVAVGAAKAVHAKRFRARRESFMMIEIWRR